DPHPPAVPQLDLHAVPLDGESGLGPGRRSQEPARSGARRPGQLREQRLPRPRAPVRPGRAPQGRAGGAGPGDPEHRARRREMSKPRTPSNAIGLISRRTRGILVAAAIMTLVGLALMIWSMAQPTPMPVILAMSVGQGLGILAFLLF